MAYSVPQIGPAEAQNFAQQRALARRKLLTGRAKGVYNRQRAGIDFSAQQKDLNTEFTRKREDLPTSYIQRGVFNSGIYRGGLQRFAADQLSAASQLQRGYQKQVGDIALGDRELEDEYATALSSIYGNELARRAQTASALRSVL